MPAASKRHIRDTLVMRHLKGMEKSWELLSQVIQECPFRNSFSMLNFLNPTLNLEYVDQRSRKEKKETNINFKKSLYFLGST